MACSGCKRRRQNIINSLKSGLRVTSEASARIRRSLGVSEDGETKKHDNIKMTADGIIKICSLCEKQSDPAPTAGQIPPLTCDKCKDQ